MTHLLPLLNSTNRFHSSTSKRKCVALAQKAAPTCTLSLTSVSVSAHGSSDSLNFIPFPSSTTLPLPSTNLSNPTSISPPKCLPPTLCLRPRLRTQSSFLRRKRSTARLAQLCTFPCSSQAESEPDQVSSTPPRKRARKLSISTPSISSSGKATFHSLAIESQAQKKGKSMKKGVAELRFLCTVYRSISWLRLQRDFAEAVRCFMKVPESMDVDVLPVCVSALDAQESLLLSRLRSYLIFNEVNPQWLDVAPLPISPFAQEVDINMDVDISESNPSPNSVLSLPTRPHLPIITQEQVAATLLFRYRYRSKGKSRPEAPATSGEEAPVRMRRKSPLAGPQTP